jgi:hypothetical protein
MSEWIKGESKRTIAGNCTVSPVTSSTRSGELNHNHFPAKGPYASS